MNKLWMLPLVLLSTGAAAPIVSGADTDCLVIQTASAQDTVMTVSLINNCNEAIVSVSVVLSHPNFDQAIRAVVDFSAGLAFPSLGEMPATLSGYLQPGQSRDTYLSTTQWQPSAAPAGATVRATGVLFANGKQSGKLDDLGYAIAGWQAQLDELRAVGSDLGTVCAGAQLLALPAPDILVRHSVGRKAARDAAQKNGRGLAEQQFGIVNGIEQQLRRAVTENRLGMLDYAATLCGYVHAKTVGLDELLGKIKSAGGR